MRKFTVLALALVLVGRATITKGTTQTIAVDTPGAPGATCTIQTPSGPRGLTTPGNVTLDTYQYGLRISETNGYGTSDAATTEYRYDPATAQPISIVEPNGSATSMTYDPSGNMRSSTDALGRQTTWTYNSFNEVLTRVDPKGNVAGCGCAADYTTNASGSSAEDTPSENASD